MVTINDINLPPHNIEAEKGLLSSILIDNEINYYLDGIGFESTDFYQKEHVMIYDSIKDLLLTRKTIDVITLSDQLKKNGNLENVGGIDYLYELSTFCITATNGSQYSKIVKEKSVLRNILKTSQNIIGDVYDEKDILDILDSIEKRIFKLTQVNLSDSLRHIQEILSMRWEEYMDIVDNPDKIDDNKVLSNYDSLDENLGGFKPGELIIVAARPSMGKTSLALNLAVNGAIKQNKSVAIFSLEMGNEQLADRMLSIISQIPMYKTTKGLLDESDFANLGEAMEKLGNTNIYIDDKGGATVEELKSKLRKLKIEKGGLDLVVIDYLQLMHSIKFAGNRVQEISEISRGLKELARELEVPIIALSQLSRAVEGRPDKKPHLSDLRESGAIEQDADSVLMLFREDYYDPDTDRKGLADVYLRKNRNGPTGEFELVFKSQTMSFFNKSGEEDN